MGRTASVSAHRSCKGRVRRDVATMKLMRYASARKFSTSDHNPKSAMLRDVTRFNEIRCVSVDDPKMLSVALADSSTISLGRMRLPAWTMPNCAPPSDRT